MRLWFETGSMHYEIHTCWMHLIKKMNISDYLMGRKMRLRKLDKTGSLVN